MMKQLGWFVVFFSFFLFLFFSFHVVSYSQSITLTQPKVIYDLPYPGLLPDHPLYTIKAIRDKLLDVLTRDYQKKVELYLLFSDKRIVMSLDLIEKGKDKLALTTLSKGEKYFLKIPFLFEMSKKQGVEPTGELVYKTKLSNTKHREIIETILKKLPQGQTDSVGEILKINETIRQQLERF